MPEPKNNLHALIVAVAVILSLAVVLLALGSSSFSLDNNLVYQGF